MKTKSSLLIITATLLWASIGIVVRKMQSFGLDSMNIVFMRYLFSACVLGIILLIKSPVDFKISFRDVPLLSANGVFSIAMFTFCYFKTISISTMSVASILMYTSPIFVMVLSVIFFREKVTWIKIAALVLAFAGCAFVSGVFGNAVKITPSALGFGLLSGLGYGLYTVFGSRLIARGFHTLQILFYTFVFAALGAFVIVLFTGANPAIFKSSVWLWALVIAVINTILPFLFYTVALKTIEGSKAAILATVEPVFATLIGFFYYGEKITLSGVIGILLVLTAVGLLNICSSERLKKHP